MHLSQDAKELLEKILTVDPNLRLNCEQVINYFLPLETFTRFYKINGQEKIELIVIIILFIGTYCNKFATILE